MIIHSGLLIDKSLKKIDFCFADVELSYIEDYYYNYHRMLIFTLLTSAVSLSVSKRVRLTIQEHKIRIG